MVGVEDAVSKDVEDVAEVGAFGVVVEVEGHDVVDVGGMDGHDEVGVGEPDAFEGEGGGGGLV